MSRKKQKSLTPAERECLLRWKRVGPLLDAIRHEELRRMTDEQYFAAMNQLLCIGFMTKYHPSASSGLVEWQKALRR